MSFTSEIYFFELCKEALLEEYFKKLPVKELQDQDLQVE